jgi:hypothetical protein
MKLFVVVLGIILVSPSFALAQSSGSSSSGAAATSGGPAGASGAAGETLSRGSTINDTGGSPRPNTSNALGRGTTGNNLRVNESSAGAGSQITYDTPAAKSAINKLGNTNTGIMKK